ncbi:hypothetical protein SODALDRAFT_375709 [Sodiomyces alkalinus F11]|uniref:Myb-like DNA-binding domain-containing protein n=1 Tax=Sodiomyces alkalinus (strain CBS 110278 / VKM F-3762 / F11) TaxID=1314773 RepID=A0A3N2QA69_SODAK|nr:hypothetical protein SODALDRAFT_375709 [Sodiomyces alkalinus F11]ROT43545.1 hypothetical protein SODALDRAFT_375709 [Sodiomyces alkalinus F11]
MRCTLWQLLPMGCDSIPTTDLQFDPSSGKPAQLHVHDRIFTNTTIKMPGEPKLGTFNESETRLLCSILRNISVEVNLNQHVDWDAVAQETGLKNAATSRTRFRQVRDKHNFKKDAPSPSKSETASPRKSSGVKKATGRVGAKGKKAAVEAPVASFDEDEGIKRQHAIFKLGSSGQLNKGDSEDSQY